MPRRQLGRTGFLDQHMVMKKLSCLALHRLRGQGRSRAFADNFFECGNAGPVAIIIEKPALRHLILRRIFTGVSHVLGHTFGQGINPVFKYTAHNNRAVTLEISNLFSGYHRAIQASRM